MHKSTSCGQRFCLPLLLIMAGYCGADEGDPVAIRYWSKGVVTIETHWNFTCRLNTTREGQSTLLPEADLVLFLDESSAIVEAKHGKSEEIETSVLDHYLDRVANEEKPRWVSSSEATFLSPNAIHLSSLADQLIVISVDGVNLLLIAQHQAAALAEIDKLLVDQTLPFFDAVLDLSGQVDVKGIASKLKSRWIVRPSAESAKGNTLAISRALRTPDATRGADVPTAAIAPKEIVLGMTPWKIPDELQSLFEEKEEASLASQQVFSKLSVEQLNFKPSNGTHTPRWNAEHMMGRELLFFSQIYAAVEPAIRVSDLNPKQMPKDYVAAHPEWNGAEEAKQMERVSAFTRRFAYLLDGMELDQKPKGSSWTVRGLLQQMQRHYGEHTENVVKKFELEDWPGE